MSLSDLQTALQSQVDAGKAFTISEATLTKAGLTPRAGLDALVRGGFMLGSADLSVAYDATVPPPAGDTLALTGTADVLGVTGATAAVCFTAPDGGTADVQIAIAPADGWTLGSTFSALATAPFDELKLGDVRYVATTLPGDTYAWNGGVQALTPGAQLFSLATLDGPLAVAVALLKAGSTSDSVALTGMVDPSKLASPDDGIPALGLSAPLTGGIALPAQFPLSTPRLELASGPGEDGKAIAWLAFATTLSLDGKPQCDLKALLASGLTTVTLALSPLQPPVAGTLDPATLISLLGVDFTTGIPPLLQSIFHAVTLKGLSATFSLGSSIDLVAVGASIGSSGPWGYGQFTITETTLSVAATAPFATALISFDAKSKLFPEVIDGEFDLGIQYDVGSGDLAVSAAFIGKLALSRVVSGLSDGGVTLPDGLELTLTELGVALDKPSQGAVEYTLYATADGAVTLPLLGVHVDGELQLLVDSAKKTYELVGGLVLGDSSFGVTVALVGSDATITGTWQALNQDYLGIDTLATAIGITAPPIPKGLDLDLESATLSYDFTKAILVLEAHSATYGKAVLVALKSTGWSFFFGLEIDRKISLSDIPIIGPDLDKVVSVAVDDIQVLVSSPLDATAAGLIDGELTRLGGGYPAVPTAGMSGVALAMVFDAGGEKTTLTIGTPASTGENALALAPAGAPPSPSDGTVWLTLQKSFGPVAFQKVGIRYRDSVLYFLMNASVSAGGLTIAVMGLGVGSPLTSFDTKFTIDGLAITYAEGPVELSGALVGKIDPVDFYGELILGVEQLQIAALGGYCEVDGHPSFFLYAVLDYPIGGPAFFFVTGLAAGFGFNRRLVIPPVDGVATFPLVQWAQGAGNPPPMDTGAIADAVTKVIGELSSSGVVAPSVGDYWLAVGVRFTSFELVESFALLTVEFGSQFEVALLGISTVQLPPAPAPAVALAQLELEAVFIPSQGLLSISGQLTPQSFVLSQDCHLTGGFAMTTWFSGEHEGEFVVTLGGYSPRFDKPSYYPAVPRLGLNWQVTPELTIAGDLYFALTSSAVMAGGGLSAVWQSGDIRAWFDVEADFLLVFEPFHYYISAGIHLGASFTVDLLFTSFKVSIHLGVDLNIWGPPFAGTATIDLSIISFTIGFGPGSPDTRTTIDWGDFVAKLIPSAPAASARKLGLAAGADDTKVPAVVQIVVQAGLLKRLTDEDGQLNWVVSGEQLQLVTQSAIPTKDWTFSPNVTLAPDAPVPNTDFGVGPVGVGSGELTSTHTIEIVSTEDSEFHADPVVRNVPAALWRQRQFDSHGVPVGVDPLNGTTVDGVAVGFTITPFVKPPDHTLPIKLVDLEYTIADPIKPFAWTDAIAPETDPFTDQTVWGTIAAAGPASVRSALVAAIASEGRAMPKTIDVSELSTQAAYDLVANPVLRLLGEQK
ncbi:DUF6603 domain-containing protein [Candidatus Solirubrobacter pratensis]|uniref:DUF6603 domain-containing protein n=1 Tax=Candidatus Solirubrobacter pratensis TaxID=1298857 RepID=UPI00040FE33A|nr:DUF6603 domain-containing protein [Candidatus Solirubrobacter pratensis]